MASSYFFYDLETSGINPRSSRIMQFAGQRTDMNLQPIGDPVNMLIRLTPDVVPDPEAILLTGITPQQTLADGVTEAEFLRQFYGDVVQPGTIYLGFNTVRFDDEFMRYLQYRNFYDAYEWQYCDDCSRWDLLDVIRMTRALRPEGIEWPYKDGKPTNRLELLTELNGLEHGQAHDALSDVTATIAVAQLIRARQPKLYDYLLNMRSKQAVQKLVEAREPFVYTSGRYPSATLHTTVAVMLGEALKGSAYVYDLRHDPSPFLHMTADELAEAARWSRDADRLRLPIKQLKYNRCPAVTTTGALRDTAVQERLQIDVSAVARHRALLRANPDFVERVIRVLDAAEKERFAPSPDTPPPGDAQAVDGQLYGGSFFQGPDKAAMRTVRSASPQECAKLDVQFQDKRLQALFPIYKARNHPQCLSDEERGVWDEFCRTRLLGGGTTSPLATYFTRLQQLAAQPDIDSDKAFLLEELQLYGESIMPVMDDSLADG